MKVTLWPNASENRRASGRVQPSRSIEFAMKLLRQISEDKVAVPTINRLGRYLLGGTAMLTCAVLVLIRELSIVHHPTAILVLTSLSAATAVACASWVSVVHIDRKSGVISRQWGFFFPGAETTDIVEAQAVALLTDQRHMDGAGQGLERHHVSRRSVLDPRNMVPGGRTAAGRRTGRISRRRAC